LGFLPIPIPPISLLKIKVRGREKRRKKIQNSGIILGFWFGILGGFWRQLRSLEVGLK
jgi:hypothetical protein